MTRENELAKNESCPCVHTTPCRDNCTCVHPYSSAGCARCCSYGSPDQQRMNAERIAAALSERVWVPMSEKLPEDHVRVLVRGYGNVFVAGHVTERARWEIVNDSWIADSEATHWMPLPEPPLAAAEGEGK